MVTMIDFLPSANQWIEFALGVGTLGGMLWGGYLILRKRIHRGRVRMNSVFQAIDDMPALQKQVNQIAKQVMPNGGSSLPDAMARIEAQQGERTQQINALAKQVSVLGMTMRATLATNSDMALFEMDAQGRLIDASKNYLRWTGKQFPEVAGWGWMNTVQTDQRGRVRSDWLEAVADCREARMRYNIIDEDQRPIEVEFVATPIPEGAANCDKFVGVLHRNLRDAA